MTERYLGRFSTRGSEDIEARFDRSRYTCACERIILLGVVENSSILNFFTTTVRIVESSSVVDLLRLINSLYEYVIILFEKQLFKSGSFYIFHV